MRIVLDTNVLISATIWSNSVAFKRIRDLDERNVSMFVSTKILAEFQNVLRRDFDFQDERIGEVTAMMMDVAELANGKAVVVEVKDDPDDDKNLECAAAGQATHILAYDRHLLKLKEFRGIQILRPEDLPV